MTKQTHWIEGETIELEFGGGRGDLTTGHVAIVQPGGMVVEYTEPLSWHVEHYSETIQGLGWSYPAGAVSSEQQAALERVIRADNNLTLPAGNLGFDLIESGDDVALVFSMTFGPESLRWDDATLHDQSWPFIATIANLVDPGTFGSQYLFTAVERHLADQGHNHE